VEGGVGGAGAVGAGAGGAAGADGVAGREICEKDRVLCLLPVGPGLELFF
jgi:hypothetical protein